MIPRTDYLIDLARQKLPPAVAEELASVLLAAEDDRFFNPKDGRSLHVETAMERLRDAIWAVVR